MSELIVKEKEIVAPGQVLATGMEYLPSHGTYRKDDQILANRLGVAVIDGKVIKTIQLSGVYRPRRNDVVIGKVIDILSAGWRVELNCPYSGMIPIRDGTFEFIPRGADLSRYFDIGDYFVGKITNVTSQKLIDVSVKGPGLHKLRGGRIININTNKVPRVIGKKGSMVSMIKQATDCKITVGQNGLVWITGEPKMENIVAKTIDKIERESHISGLTDKIKTFLEKETGRTISLEDRKDDRNSDENNQEE
ncbi:MAG: exosome complex RNA-binding protein Rrp4 [Patescibacteria group bacterium]|nr:exosome complex RNA-binding protein Rrp4 [Patescibacteria group bacterium]